MSISVSTGRWICRVPAAVLRSGVRPVAGARQITVSTVSRSCSDDLRQYETQRHYSMGRASSYCSMEGEP